MRCIAVINQKGGVGKTTTTVNLGAALARRGKRVLLLDLDPQANMTLHLDCQTDDEHATMSRLLLEVRPLAELLRATSTPGLYVVPADSTLGGVEQQLANRHNRELILRDALTAYRDAGCVNSLQTEPLAFDFVLFDCPPSLGVLSANALIAANEVVIPMQAEYFSLQGMAKLIEVIELVRARLNPSLHISRVLPCMLDVRTRLTAEVLAEIRRHFGDLVSDSPIRANVKLAEAPSFGRTIFEHDPDCNGAIDYAGLADELLGADSGTDSGADSSADSGAESGTQSDTDSRTESGTTDDEPHAAASDPDFFADPDSPLQAHTPPPLQQTAPKPRGPAPSNTSPRRSSSDHFDTDRESQLEA